MLHIEATKYSPSIHYHEDRAILEISGESHPENSFVFFKPVFDWLRTELPGLERLTLVLHIAYMNSSSTKCMLDVLDMLDERFITGADIRVRWYYDAGNERAADLAEEFQEDMSMPFEILPLEPGEPIL